MDANATCALTANPDATHNKGNCDHNAHLDTQPQGPPGQNAISQAENFTKVAPLTGLALTKLDGTAKGGVVIGISDQFQIPVKYIGVGEGIER